MAKKLAIIFGILVVYLLLLFAFGPSINIILFVGGIAYAIYRNNR